MSALEKQKIRIKNNKKEPISRYLDFQNCPREGKKLICTLIGRIPRPTIAEIESRWHFYRSAIAFRRALFRVVVIVVVVVVVVVVVTCARARDTKPSISRRVALQTLPPYMYVCMCMCRVTPAGTTGWGLREGGYRMIERHGVPIGSHVSFRSEWRPMSERGTRGSVYRSGFTSRNPLAGKATLFERDPSRRVPIPTSNCAVFAVKRSQ